MSTVSLTLPADGDTIDASDVNNPLNAIAAVVNGSIDSTNVAAGGLTPANLTSGTGTSWAWQTWTPTFTNISGGTLNYSKYIQIGKTVFFRLKYTLAGAGVSSSATFTLPVTASSDYSGTADPYFGHAHFRDDSASLTYLGYARVSSSTTAILASMTGASGQLQGLSSGVPFTWANLDSISVVGTYEAA